MILKNGAIKKNYSVNITEVKKKMESYKHKKDKSNSKLSNNYGDLNKLKNEINEKNNIIRSLNNEYNKLSKLIVEKDIKIKELNTQNNTIKKLLKQGQCSTNINTNININDFKVSGNCEKDYKNELNISKDTLSIVMNKVNNYKQKTKNLKTEIKELNCEIQVLNSENKNLSLKLTTANNINFQLKDKVNKYKNILKDYNLI